MASVQVEIYGLGMRLFGGRRGRWRWFPYDGWCLGEDGVAYLCVIGYFYPLLRLKYISIII